MSYASEAEFKADLRRAAHGDKKAQRRAGAFIDGRERRNGGTVRSQGSAGFDFRGGRTGTVRSRHTIVQPALRHAVALLGITRTVEILWVNDDDIPGANGDHRFMNDTHVIRLRVGQTAEATRRTLVHELAHAASAGGYGDPGAWKRAYNADPKRYEDEADEIARVLAHLKLVT